MAKRKVIKFVCQGYRTLNPNEYYLWGGELTRWFGAFGSSESFEVYHRIETEEEVPRWRAEHGGKYFFAAIIDVLTAIEEGGISDNLLYKSGNYFQTKEQAQKYLDHCKTFFENN